MKYLVRRARTGKAHHWVSGDTLCRMASTGGLNVNRYLVKPTTDGRAICRMCCVIRDKRSESDV
jgi:hypothetical protein